MEQKLTIGVFLDDYELEAWAHEMLQQIKDSDFAEIKLVVFNDSPSTSNTSTPPLLTSRIRQLLEKTYRTLIERNIDLPDAMAKKNAAGLLDGISTLKIQPDHKQGEDYFLDDDIASIKQHDIDIFVHLGFDNLRGTILNVAKHGIWSLHHGDTQANRSGPAGFWESMENWSETGSTLQILSADQDNDKVLCRSYSSTITMSLTDNKSNYLWKSLSFMLRKMKRLHDIGDEKFFTEIDTLNQHPEFYSEKHYENPNNYELAKLVLKKLYDKAVLFIHYRIYVDQWILLFHLKDSFSPSLWRYKKILPPKDRFWADPHIIYRDNTYYIYIEELLYSTDKGHLSLIIMDEEGNYEAPITIIDKPYHLSYPFVIEDKGELYMIPESIENNTIELYKCTEFPHKWEFHMNLMEDIKAVDATFHYHNDRWWMFANVIEHEGASTMDELFLYSSKELLSTDWTPHPLNPIISDCKTSRPAGKIFIENGKLYRPSQNSKNHYGYGFNINEIKVLDEENYQEDVVSAIEPNWDKDILATHTYNREGSLHIIDAINRRYKWGDD